MTNQNEMIAMISTDRFDTAFAVVEAFLDGERVDSQTLKHALADAAAREHFVDLLALREAVGSMAPGVWSAGQPAGCAPSSAMVHRRSRRRGEPDRGYFAGQRADAASSSVEAVIQFERPPAAPTPTQVISLRPGINWTENSGGH